MPPFPLPYPHAVAARYRAVIAGLDRDEQIRRDGEFARRLQEQEEEMLVAASIRSANERRLSESSPQVPFVPPVVPSEHGSDGEEEEESLSTSSSTSTPPLDSNGAYTPLPYNRRLPSVPVIPPVVHRNGPYTPYPHHARLPSRQSAPVIPPVVPPETSMHDRNDGNAPGTYWPPQPPQPREPTPFIPPVLPPSFPSQPRQSGPVIPPVVPEPNRSVPSTNARRAATPAPSRPMYEPWYPPGVIPYHLRAQTPAPMMQPAYYYQQQQPRTAMAAPPIPPIVRQRKPSVADPSPPKQTDEVITPFIPPMPDEKPSPKPARRPILKPKPASAILPQKPAKATGSSESDYVQTSKKTAANADTSVPRGRRNSLRMPPTPPPEAEARARVVVEATENSESSESDSIVDEDEVPNNDVDLESGPLYDLRKHVSLLTGSFKCNECSAMIHPKPIHKHSTTSSSSLPPLGSHLHPMCSDCRKMYCRGCHRISYCRRTCNSGSDDKCLLKTCCRAGRAIAIFAILSCFDAKFLAMVSNSPHSTYFSYIKNALSSSSTSSLSTLLLTTIKSLLPWLPIDPIHAKSRPHVHASVEPLFRVSLLLEVIRIYLYAPRDRWIRPGNGVVYEHILMFLRRLEEVGKGAIAGLVLKPGRDVERTRGVGEVVWALADRGRGTGQRKIWTAGSQHESFSEILGDKNLRRDLQYLKDKIQDDQKEKKALLEQFLCRLLSWSMSDALKI